MQENSPSDLDAFREIIEEHQGSIRAFLTVRLDDPFEAHDLAQEVFLIAWKKADELDFDRPIRPWLLSVAANLVRQHRRKHRAAAIGGNDVVLDYLDERAEADACANPPEGSSSRL
jgi:RNA polymerase sigma-70 factor (ECF subfamily)